LAGLPDQPNQYTTSDGAALSYARRYALFALVGIAGEDDLDVPDLLIESPPAISVPTGQNQNGHRSRKLSVHKRSQSSLTPEASGVLRDELIAEINGVQNADELALWAHRRFATKNTLMADDAKAVETAYLEVLKAADDSQGTEAGTEPPDPTLVKPENETVPVALNGPAEINHQRHKVVTPLPKSPRARNKAHLRFVAAQPCLVCQRSPCDAHHVKFAEPRALGRKVSGAVMPTAPSRAPSSRKREGMVGRHQCHAPRGREKPVGRHNVGPRQCAVADRYSSRCFGERSHEMKRDIQVFSIAFAAWGPQ
jgi:hypothetical protein